MAVLLLMVAGAGGGWSVGELRSDGLRIVPSGRSDVCRGTAEIAWQMTRQGMWDAAVIQAAVDARWGPSGAKEDT